MSTETKFWPCMVCEKRYRELEEAEMCERRHDAKAAEDAAEDESLAWAAEGERARHPVERW